MFRYWIWAAFVCLFASVRTATAADLYAAIGDSITEAVRANTSIGGYADPVLEDAGLKPRSGEGRSRQAKTTEDFSWASGQKIFSQWLLLKNFTWIGFFDPIYVLNFAERGNRAVDLEKQAEKVVTAMKSGKYRSLSYVTMLVGANDICSNETPTGTPNSSFQSALSKIYAKLSEIHQAKKIRMMVVGVPNVPDLGRPEINDARVAPGVTCKRIRKLLHACQDVLNWTTEAEYLEKVDLVRAKNDILEASTRAASAMYSNLDVVYSDRMFKTKITIPDLAADCFHPNSKGQQKLSLNVWEDQPWFQ